MQTVRFDTEQWIYREGDPCDAVYQITSGTVEIWRGGEMIRRLREGDVCGELGIVDEMDAGHARHESAKAADDVEALAVPRAEFRQVLETYPPQLRKILDNLSRGVRAALDAPPTASEKPAAENKDSERLAFAFDKLANLMERRCNALESRILASEEDSLPANLAGQNEQSEMTREQFRAAIEDFGPIKPLLEDETVNDILVNAPDKVYVERKGKLELTDIRFPDDSMVLAMAKKIAEDVGRKIDPRKPLLDTRLLNGSRVNIITQPLAVDAVSISIRKFSNRTLTLDIMAEQNNMSTQLADFLRVAGKAKLNIIISGGTGSGKTTLMNAISQSISNDERIITIEDAAELKLQQPHVVRLETQPFAPGVRRDDVVNMRDLVKNALRMRPDRIIVGEVRGDEAFDMLQAMNTGHEGSMSTIHSNHPRDALSRLENMINMANTNLTIKALRQQIASAINLVVQISRMRDGQRRVTYVSEVVGMEGDVVVMQDLFVFARENEDELGNVKGTFKWTGIMPRFMRRVGYYGEHERLEAALGVKIPRS